MNRSDDLLPAAEAARFEGYLEQLVPVLRQPARAPMARVYCLGLLAAPGRKSIEPLAGLHGARHGSKLYQALHHFVADARWDDAALLAAVAREVLPAIERHGPIRAWIIDDTALAKKGRHSVGVAAQYSGRLGTTTNCQVAVSLSLANAAASLPVAWRLYLPAAWTSDRQRRLAAGVPAGVRFATKPEIALEQLGAAVARDLPRGVVLADEAYGGAVQFRDGVRDLGLDYAVAIDRAQGLLLPDGKGPLAARAAAHLLPEAAWQAVPVRPDGLRYAALRVRAAPYGRPGPEEWLLCERGRGPGGALEERFWLASLPATTGLEELVTTATLRWRVERDYQELKQEVGLAHFEGRGWRGFHHHAALCIAAYGFLVRERCLFPPEPPGRPDRATDTRATAAAQPALHRLAQAGAREGPDPTPALLSLVRQSLALHHQFA
jgi:SRSO17 transposase